MAEKRVPTTDKTEALIASHAELADVHSISRSVTFVVAASDAPDIVKAQADYVCDGTDDHVEIQAALNALPSTGGEIRFSEGTFHIEQSCGRNISNITLAGAGKSTIFTTSTEDITFFLFEGTAESKLSGISTSDLQINGANLADYGIYLRYVEKSSVRGVLVKNCPEWDGISVEYSQDISIVQNFSAGCYEGVSLNNSINCLVLDNVCNDATYDGDGIALVNGANRNVVVGNVCRGNGNSGIYIYNSKYNTIQGNHVSDNGEDGIVVRGSSRYNSVVGNFSRGNIVDGIWVDNSSHNKIVGNYCTENSQQGNNLHCDIRVTGDSEYNLIADNTCRAGTLTNKPKYGIDIYSSNCSNNKVINNDLYDDGFGTAPFNDAGTDTIYVDPSETEDAIAKKHDRSHAITSPSDHTSSATPGQILKADTNGLPVNATNTDTEVSNAVTKAHDRQHAVTSTSDHTVTGLTASQLLRVNSGGTAIESSGKTADDIASKVITITFIIDGGGSAITTGQKGHLEIPFACTITGWTLLADQSGSIVIDVWKDTYANFPPTSADSITGSEKPTLSSAQKNQDLELTTWTTAVSAGDILAFNVDSASTVTRVTLSIRANKV